MPATPRMDPGLQRVIELLPVDGSPVLHSAWRAAVIADNYQNVQHLQAARRSGDVIFEVGDPDNPGASLTVRRAVPVTPPAPLSSRTVAPTTTTTPKAGA